MPIKKALDGLVLKVPLIGPIVKEINIARTMKLLAAESPVVLNNRYYQEAFARMSEKMKRGEKLSQALKNYSELFPPMVGQMVEVGEATGSLVGILKKLGDYFEKETAQDIKKLADLARLMLMIALGGLVGLFLVSLLRRAF